MGLDTLLERLHREARNRGTVFGSGPVPVPEALKPADFREKSGSGTAGTAGTAENKRGGVEPETLDPAERAAVARRDHGRCGDGDDDQRGGDASAHRARAAALIERCDAAGVRLRLAGDGLRVGRAIAERPDLADELRARRYGVLVELRAREGLCFICGDPAPPVSTMPSGEPVHVDCLDRAVAACKGLEP